MSACYLSLRKETFEGLWKTAAKNFYYYYFFLLQSLCLPSEAGLCLHVWLCLWASPALLKPAGLFSERFPKLRIVLRV